MRRSTQVLHDMPQGQTSSLMSPNPVLRGGLTSVDGPVISSTLPMSLSASGSFHSANFGPNYIDEGQRELLSGNMSLSVLHLHDMHHRQRRSGFMPGHFARTRDTIGTATVPGRNVVIEGGAVGPNQRPPSNQMDLDANAMQFSYDATLLQQRQLEYPPFTRQGKPQRRLSIPQSPPAAGYDEPFSAPFAHPLSQDSFSLQDFPSLPPLESPGFLNAPASSSHPPSEGVHSMSTAPSVSKPPTDPMPQIMEDVSGEHEIDTSQQ